MISKDGQPTRGYNQYVFSSLYSVRQRCREVDCLVATEVIKVQSTTYDL